MLERIASRRGVKHFEVYVRTILYRCGVHLMCNCLLVPNYLPRVALGSKSALPNKVLKHHTPISEACTNKQAFHTSWYTLLASDTPSYAADPPSRGDLTSIAFPVVSVDGRASHSKLCNPFFPSRDVSLDAQILWQARRCVELQVQILWRRDFVAGAALCGP